MALRGSSVGDRHTMYAIERLIKEAFQKSPTFRKILAFYDYWFKRTSQSPLAKVRLYDISHIRFTTSYTKKGGIIDPLSSDMRCLVAQGEEVSGFGVINISLAPSEPSALLSEQLEYSSRLFNSKYSEKLLIDDWKSSIIHQLTHRLTMSRDPEQALWTSALGSTEIIAQEVSKDLGVYHPAFAKVDYDGGNT